MLLFTLKDHLTVEIVYDYEFCAVKDKLDKINSLDGNLHLDDMRIDINDVVEVII